MLSWIAIAIVNVNANGNANVNGVTADKGCYHLIIYLTNRDEYLQVCLAGFWHWHLAFRIRHSVWHLR